MHLVAQCLPERARPEDLIWGDMALLGLTAQTQNDALLNAKGLNESPGPQGSL